MRLFQILLLILILDLVLIEFNPIGIAQEPRSSDPLASVEAPNLIFNESNNSISVKYWQFTLKIYKGSNGLIEWFTHNGSLFLQDRHTLQYFLRPNWLNLSIPYGLEWNFINKTAMEIKKTYLTGSRLGMNLTFLVVSCKPVKYSVDLNLPGAYVLRYSWALSFKNQANFTIQAPRKVAIGNNATFQNWMLLDWGDVIDTKGNIITASISRSGANINGIVNINIGSLAANTPYNLDPSYIGDSTNAFSIGYPYSRKYWFCNTRMYIFYTNGSHLGFRSNTSLTAWSSFTAIRRCENGQHFGVAMNNSHVAYAYSNGSAGSKPIYWRMGSVSSGGSITWLGPSEYFVTNMTYGYAIGAWPVPIFAGPTGWPYIIFTTAPSIARINLTRSAYSNGSWSNSFNRVVTPGSYSCTYGGGSNIGASTENIRMYWLNGSQFWSCFYNRSADSFQTYFRVDSWQAYPTSTYGFYWSCVSDDTYEVVAWLGRRSGTPINYSLCFDFQKSGRPFNATDERILVTNGLPICPLLILNSSFVTCFNWDVPTASHCFLRTRDLSINFMSLGDPYANYWPGSSTDLFTDTPTSNNRHCAISTQQGNKIFYIYQNETSSPYHLKWFNLTFSIGGATTTFSFSQAAEASGSLQATRFLIRMFTQDVNVINELLALRIIIRSFGQESIVYQEFLSSAPLVLIVILSQAVRVYQAIEAVLPGFPIWWIIPGLFLLCIVGALFLLAFVQKEPRA